jgi:hypothetical protein
MWGPNTRLQLEDKLCDASSLWKSAFEHCRPRVFLPMLDLSDDGSQGVLTRGTVADRVNLWLGFTAELGHRTSFIEEILKSCKKAFLGTCPIWVTVSAVRCAYICMYVLAVNMRTHKVMTSPSQFGNHSALTTMHPFETNVV